MGQLWFGGAGGRRNRREAEVSFGSEGVRCTLRARGADHGGDLQENERAGAIGSDLTRWYPPGAMGGVPHQRGDTFLMTCFAPWECASHGRVGMPSRADGSLLWVVEEV